MSTEWTVDRLDALPEGTVIAYRQRPLGNFLAVRHSDEIWDVKRFEGTFHSAGLLRYADPDSIRVVSVPIDALLADETLSVALEAGWVPDGFGSWSSERVVRAAIAHVTGEATP